MALRAVLLLAATTVVAAISAAVPNGVPQGSLGAEASAIQINVNGQRVHSPVAQPMMLNDRVMVPIRGIFERIQADLTWIQEDRLVIARKNNRVITLKIGESYGTVDGTMVKLDAPAMIVNGRTLVPLRYLAEALDAYVMWDNGARTVVVTSKIDT